MNTKIDIKSLEPQRLEQELSDLGQPKFRAKQIFHWLHTGVTGFDEMTDLPKKFRQSLDEQYYITVPAVENKQVSAADGTVKYLWRLGDGNCVESVLMRYEHGNTVCISSQVGCSMGCAFCASTLGGLIRNLAPSEMLDQVLFTQKDTGEKISNIVMMGIGEPLDNFDSVISFLKLVNHPDGINIGMRHISLSSCGLTEKIDKLAQYNLQLTLAISMHAPDDETRTRLMPVNKAYGISRLIEACRRYFEITGRRISFEYAMIAGVNDSLEQAEVLGKLVKGSHVNLIRLNHVEGSPFQPSSGPQMTAFQKKLEEKGVTVTLRRRLGGDIDASCGQLRRKFLKQG